MTKIATESSDLAITWQRDTEIVTAAPVRPVLLSLQLPSWQGCSTEITYLRTGWKASPDFSHRLGLGLWSGQDFNETDLESNIFVVALGSSALWKIQNEWPIERFTSPKTVQCPLWEKSVNKPIRNKYEEASITTQGSKLANNREWAFLHLAQKFYFKEKWN